MSYSVNKEVLNVLICKIMLCYKHCRCQHTLRPDVRNYFCIWFHSYFIESPKLIPQVLNFDIIKEQHVTLLNQTYHCIVIYAFYSQFHDQPVFLIFPQPVFLIFHSNLALNNATSLQKACIIADVHYHSKTIE